MPGQRGTHDKNSPYRGNHTRDFRGHVKTEPALGGSEPVFPSAFPQGEGT